MLTRTACPFYKQRAVFIRIDRHGQPYTSNLPERALRVPTVKFGTGVHASGAGLRWEKGKQVPIRTPASVDRFRKARTARKCALKASRS